jgi:hypothetical protein
MLVGISSGVIETGSPGVVCGQLWQNLSKNPIDAVDGILNHRERSVSDPLYGCVGNDFKSIADVVVHISDDLHTLLDHGSLLALVFGPSPEQSACDGSGGQVGGGENFMAWKFHVHQQAIQSVSGRPHHDYGCAAEQENRSLRR